MSYSDAAKDFVCPECLRRGSQSSTLKRPAATPWWKSNAFLVTAVSLCLAAIVIVLATRAKPPAADERRAWEDAHRDKIVALKSDAEALVIDNKLPEAHAKYRELEKLVGARTIQDPRLFDLIDQARLDQSRVYAMIMHSMAPQVVYPNNGLPPQVASQSTATSPPPAPAPIAQAQRQERVQRWMDSVTPSTAPAPAPAPSSEGPATVPAPAPAREEFAKTQAAVEATQPTETVNAVMPTTAPVPEPSVSDAKVEAALRRGADFLISQFDNGELQRHAEESDLEHQGLDALAVYALLQTSRAISDPRLGIKGEFLTQAIAKLKSLPFADSGELSPPTTYGRSLRASALATYNRAEDRDVLTADVKWLIAAAVDGAYTYDDRDSRRDAPALRNPRGPRSRRHVPTGEMGDVVQASDLWRSGGAPVRLIHNGEIMMPPGPSGPMLPPPPPRMPVPRTYRAPRPTYGNMPALRRYPTAQQEYKTPFFWDNSNSQYGVLGVWAGAEVGIEVPDKYWKAVRQHWTDCQLPSGQWSYMPGTDPTYSMTCGGVASLLITHDYLDAPQLAAARVAGQKPYDDALTAGLAYLEDGDNVVNFLQTAPNNMLFAGYNLFGLERVGLASGLKYFGSHDWFVELCERVLPTQWPGGAWGRGDQGKQAVIDTSYILLFLARGRHPIIMNKLKFDGPWTNRPRDVANLAAYASREMERPVNWQAVDLSRSPDDWADSPILYLASNRALELGPEDVTKLREFVEAGGLLFTHADASSGSFTTWAAGLAKTMFPQYPLADLPADHPLYSLNFKLPKPHPRLQGVSNGSRLLMVHAPTDLAGAWQTRATISKKELFQLGVNLYVYTTGKERFRNRLDTRAVPPPFTGAAPSIDVAQLQYEGNWNPEPGAWLRFARVFQNGTGTRLNVFTAKAADVEAGKLLIVMITGIGAKVPGEADIPPLKKFIADGGTILIDACGGSGEFATYMEAWLARLAPDARLEPIPPEDELFKDLPPKALRLYAIEQLRND